MSAPSIQLEHNKKVLKLADQYLLGLVKHHILKSNSASDTDARQRLAKYLAPGERLQNLTGRGGIFHQLVHTAQDWGMAPTVIGRAIGGVENLEKVLLGFNAERLVEKHPNVDDWKILLNEIAAELKPKGKVRREKRSLWPRYCRSVISSALFLFQFKTIADFYGWLEPLERDVTRRIELPQRLNREIVGYGFTLACLFFMEIGYASFLKPDIWVIRFCNKLNITSSQDP